MPSTEITVATRRAKEIVDVTDEIDRWLAGAAVDGGLCNLFVAHTTAALTVGEAIEGTDEDLLETLVKMIPKIAFRHGHDPSPAPDHMIASIVGASLTLPIARGRLRLGTWQRVLLVECNGPRRRTLPKAPTLGRGDGDRRRLIRPLVPTAREVLHQPPMDNPTAHEQWRREAAFFDAEAAQHRAALAPIDPLALARYRSPSLRRRFACEFRLRTVGDLRGRRVLDVGCGEGGDAILLARLGAARVTGVDLSSEAIALARARARLDGVADRVDFVCAPIEIADLPDRAFDLVWCSAILHHVTDRLDEVMARLVRAARPGGLLSFGEPTARNRTLRRARRLIPIRAGAVTPDERPLEPADLAILRRHLPDLAMRHFALLGRIDPFLLRNYERASLLRRGAVNLTGAADWLLLSLPWVDRLGSVSVMWGHAPRE